MENQRLPLMASLIAVGSGVVWSFGAVMSREADGVDAFQYLVWRSLGVIVVVEVMHLLNRPHGSYRPKIVTAWTTGRTMAGANLGVFIASLSFVYAVKTTTPANAAFLGSLTPLATVALSRFLGERLARSTIVAIAVALGGLVLTVYGDLEAGNMLGNAAALFACFGFALYTICVRSDPERDWSPSLPGYALLMIVVCGAITIAKGNPLVPDPVDIAWAVLHGGVVIVLGTLMFNHASRQVPAVPMTVFAQAEMVFVPVWAVLVLGSRPTALTIVGGCVIFSAVIGKAIHDARRPGHPADEHLLTPDLPLI